MSDDLKVGSVEWWLRKLEKQLKDQQKRIAKPEKYYEGEHEMRFASQKFGQAFGKMFLAASDNWMPLVVDSVQERLRVEGFRVGSKTAGDKRVWRIWQANNLDSDSDVVHTEALIGGQAYTQVWYNADDEKTPNIYIEHPSQVTVALSPEDRRTRLAALKLWADDDGFRLANLYLPEGIYKFRSTSRYASSASTWARRESRTESWPLRNPLGIVPVIPIASRRRMLKEPVSEIENLIPTQDKINKLTFDMMIAAEYAAFRQRWATGLSIPTDPETKQPIEPFKAAVDRLWTSASKDTTFGEFDVTDLSNYVSPIEMEVQHLVSQSRTPPHYVFVRGNMPSGESLRAAETGLVAKAGGRQRSFGEGWEETMRVALAVAGTVVKGADSMSTQWADAESRTESEHTDSVLKKLAMGVPLRQVWRDAEYSDEQIDGFIDMLKEEKAYRELLDAARPVAVSAGQTKNDPAVAAGVSANDSAPQ